MANLFNIRGKGGRGVIHVFSVMKIIIREFMRPVNFTL
jgi:hypothetical protein